MFKLEKTYEFKTKKDLVVEFSSENYGLSVVGWEKETSEFFIKFDFEKEENQDILIEDIVDTKYNKKKNTLYIKLNEPDNIKYMESHLELKVPHVTEIIAKTENGGISIENLHGIQTVTTENGAVKMDHVNGDLVCKTENGAMKLLDCNSDANLETENGSLKMKKCDGNFNVKSENGSFKLIGCKGSLDLENENGAIRVQDAEFSKVTIMNQNGMIYYEFTPIDKGQFKFENENGKIHLIIPDEVPYEIEARNELGGLHVGLEGNYDRRQEGNTHIIEMVKGSGKVEIFVKNRHGSISFMNNPIKDGKFKFDMSHISKAMDNAMKHIPDEYCDKEKILRKMEKAKKKLKNIKIPDMKSVMTEVMTDVQDEMKNVYKDFSTEEFKEKAEQEINEGISMVMGKVQEKVKDQSVSEQEKREVNERSRLKILQMLSDGKITADEAEKLLKAMEQRNGR
jgi:hypothetical protein